VRRVRRKLIGAKVSPGDGALPVPAILGPLLGLGYILVLPVVAIVAFLLLIILRGTGSAGHVWHKATHPADC